MATRCNVFYWLRYLRVSCNQSRTAWSWTCPARTPARFPAWCPDGPTVSSVWNRERSRADWRSFCTLPRSIHRLSRCPRGLRKGRTLARKRNTFPPWTRRRTSTICSGAGLNDTNSETRGKSPSPWLILGGRLSGRPWFASLDESLTELWRNYPRRASSPLHTPSTDPTPPTESPALYVFQTPFSREVSSEIRSAGIRINVTINDTFSYRFSILRAVKFYFNLSYRRHAHTSTSIGLSRAISFTFSSACNRNV